MKLVPLSSLFEVRYGHSLELNRLKQIPREQGGFHLFPARWVTTGLPRMSNHL
jgi:hypothetical protein